MIKKYFFAVLLGSGTMAAGAIEKPKLVVTVVVDALRADDFARYSKNFSDNGLGRLAGQGAVAANARYDFVPNEPVVSDVTILSGASPRTHGIVGDFWYEEGGTRMVSAVTISPSSARVATVHTLLEKLKEASPKSKVASIGMDPSSAIAGGGNVADRVVWYNRSADRWVDASGEGKGPWWLETLNDGRTKERYLSSALSPTLPKNRYSAQPVSKIFDGRKELKGMDIWETPFANSYLNDCLSSMLVFDRMGKEERTDFLMINYTYPKEAYSRYGAGSMEVEDAYYKLDADVARLFQILDNEVGRGEYVVIFTAASGASKKVEGTVNEQQIRVLTNAFLNTQYGIDDWVVAYKNGAVYLNHATIYKNKKNLSDVQDAVASFIMKFDGIEKTVTASAMARNNYSKGIGLRVYNSYNAHNSGDVMITLKPCWLSLEKEEKTTERAVFSTPYEESVSVPLLIYGKGIKSGRVYDEIDMTDIAATIADILDIARPEMNEGRSFYKEIKNY